MGTSWSSSRNIVLSFRHDLYSRFRVAFSYGANIIVESEGVVVYQSV